MLLKPFIFTRLCEARELLCADTLSPLSVREIAEELGLSPFHFIRQFEALFGRTPHQYRTHNRLEIARQLLSSGRLSVTEVCMEVGFSSLGSFSELFKRHHGASPSRYLKRVFQVPSALHKEPHLSCFGLMSRLPAAAFSTPRNFQEA